MKKYRKKIVLAVLSIGLCLAVGIRIYATNKNIEGPTVETYKMGEEVFIEDNIFWDKYENSKGYTVTVNSGELMTYEEFLTSHKQDVEKVKNGSEMVVNLRITVRNTNEEDHGQIGIFVGEYRLIDGDCRLSKDSELFMIANPTVPDSQYIAIRPGTEMDFEIPFVFSPNHIAYAIPVKRVVNHEFYLSVSLYPIQKNIQVTIKE